MGTLCLDFVKMMNGRIGAEQKRQSTIGVLPPQASLDDCDVTDYSSSNPFYSDPPTPTDEHNHYATPMPKSATRAAQKSSTSAAAAAPDITTEEPNKSSQSWLYRNKRTGKMFI